MYLMQDISSMGWLVVLQVVCFIWPNTKYCIMHKQVQAWKGVSSKGNRSLEDAPEGVCGSCVVLSRIPPVCHMIWVFD